MVFKKEKFLKSELGSNMIECVNGWDNSLSEVEKHSIGTDEYRRVRNVQLWCQAQWEVYKIAVKQFYNIEMFFTRTDEYFGICTSDEEFIYKRNY